MKKAILKKTLPVSLNSSIEPTKTSCENTGKLSFISTILIGRSIGSSSFAPVLSSA